MKKKIISMLLATVVTITMLGGCGSESSQSKESGESQNTEATEESEDDEENASAGQEAETADDAGDAVEGEIAQDAFAGTTLKIAVWKSSNDKSEDINDKPAFKMAEEATGIHIDWIEIDQGMEDKTDILLSSDMPDAFLGALDENRIAQNKELFYDLSEPGLLETYAPHVLSDLESLESGLDIITWPGGAIYSLPCSKETMYTDWVFDSVYINKTWLDNLGLDMPSTQEEFYEAMKAFKENDANGNGDPTDEIPISFCNNNWCSGFLNLAGSFGIGMTFSYESSGYSMVKDGVVTPTMNTDEYRQFLEFYHKLAEEGLLDVEGFSQTTDQYLSKLKSGVVGIGISYNNYGYMPDELASQYVALTPYAVEGITPVASGKKNHSGLMREYFAISKDANVQAMLHWWDFLSSSTEMKMTVRAGERGGSWDLAEDGHAYDKTPDGLTDDFTITNWNYTYGLLDRSPFLRDDEYYIGDKEEDFQEAASWNKKKLVDGVYEYLQDEYLPIRYVDADKVTERTFIENDLFDYIANFRATSVVEGVTDESWDAYVKGLDDYGYSEWIQWYQDYLDGKF